MGPAHSPNKLFATKYCFLILGIVRVSCSLFLYFSTFLWLFYVIINFFRNHFIIFFFFMKIIFIFSCSGMFRVPGFIDGPRGKGFNKIFSVFHVA